MWALQTHRLDPSVSSVSVALEVRNHSFLKQGLERKTYWGGLYLFYKKEVFLPRRIPGRLLNYFSFVCTVAFSSGRAGPEETGKYFKITERKRFLMLVFGVILVPTWHVSTKTDLWSSHKISEACM